MPHERHVERIGQSLCGMAIDDDAVAETITEAVPELIAQCAQFFGCGRQTHACDVACGSKPDEVGHVFSTGAATALVSRSVNQRFERDAAANEQRADAFWGIELVPSNAQEIDAEVGHIHFDFAERLS